MSSSHESHHYYIDTCCTVVAFCYYVGFGGWCFRVFFFFFGDFCHSFWTTPGLCLKCAHFWGLWDTCRFFLCVFVCWSLNCCRVCHHNFSISCEAAECLGVWGRPSTCALCGLPIHLTNCHSPCLLSVQFWPGFWLEHTHISRFSCSLLTEDVFVTKQNF